MQGVSAKKGKRSGPAPAFPTLHYGSDDSESGSEVSPLVDVDMPPVLSPNPRASPVSSSDSRRKVALVFPASASPNRPQQTSTSSSPPSPSTSSPHITSSHSASASNLLDPPPKRSKTDEFAQDKLEYGAPHARPARKASPKPASILSSQEMLPVGELDGSDKIDQKPPNRKRQRTEQISDEVRRARAILSDLVDETYHVKATNLQSYITDDAARAMKDRRTVLTYILAHREYIRCNGDATLLTHPNLNPTSFYTPGLEPLFWGTALPQVLHASGDSDKPHHLTAWRAEWQLSRFYKDILTRIKSPDSQSTKRGKPWCSLDMLAEALLPDVFAIRLCEYVVRWIKKNRKRNFVSAESSEKSAACDDASDVADEAQILEAAELAAEVDSQPNGADEVIDPDPYAAPRLASALSNQEDDVFDAWRPSQTLEAQLLSLAPHITFKTVELERLKRRHEQSAFVDSMDEKAYSHFARCVRVSLARQKGKLSQFLLERCNGDSCAFRFPPEVLECLGVLGTEFIARLVARAKAFPGSQSTSLYRDSIYPTHVPRYANGDLLTLNSAPAPSLQFD
eukprot:TRINITY_DN2505_c0_g1_i1.p1 TRINITY_DN2505_c0_g1~~TRINITY_DN2505_c0_g1_i1.p1  ORF type:complete len:568 (+),score=96.95 TRINITY_DN2505_c0_g1_i1:144-1847(+)